MHLHSASLGPGLHPCSIHGENRLDLANLDRFADLVDRNADQVFAALAIVVTATVVVAEFAIAAWFTNDKTDIVAAVLPVVKVIEVAALPVAGALIGKAAWHFAFGREGGGATLPMPARFRVVSSP